MRTTKILKQTPSQTAGPYLHIGCIPHQIGIDSSFQTDLNNLVLSNETKGYRIAICGKIYDGNYGLRKKFQMILSIILFGASVFCLWRFRNKLFNSLISFYKKI